MLQIADGDRVAFKTLYERYFPEVQKYVTFFEPKREYLDELTQNIFVKLWEKREKLAAIESFKDYLFMTSRNTVFNYFRAIKASKPTLELDENTGMAVQGDSEDLFLYKQYYNIVLEAIEQLPFGRKNILKMTIIEGMSIDEIAEKLDISRSGVKNQLSKAYAFVRQYLKDHGEMTVLLFVFLSLFDM